ncbi:MAG: AMP-binding protein [Deltaproteobacteria bacterium]|nr:AMP-binding protein [Deltaproteobacteria bacterium]
MEIVHKTINRMLDEAAARHPNNDALIHTEFGIRYNYTLFLWEVERVARGLIRLGIAKGDRVALWAPNLPEWVIAQAAVFKSGAVLVPVDPGATKEDLAYVLEQSEARAVIMARGIEEEEYLDTIRSLRGDLPLLDHVIVVALPTYLDTLPWGELAGLGDETDPELLRIREKQVDPEDPVALMYTSGTTGRPKGVVLDHLGLINKSLCSTRRQGLNHRDRLCLFFPLFHMFGNTCIGLSGLLIGASLILPCRIFDPSRILKTLCRERCTAIYGSPSMIIGLLDHPEFSKRRWSTVRKGILGGAPCPMELMKRLVNQVGVSDITVAYGITEASSWITMTRPDDPLELRVSTIGTPLECNEVKLVNPATGEDLPPNTQGELCVRGFLMKSYYKMPAATAGAVDRDGWLHSGDLGEMDERGYVRITGRLKDVITRDGVEIHPSEVEEIIYRLPEISEVQVFGFSHPERGQEVAAWVKLKEGARLSIKELARYVSRKVDENRLPDYFKVVESFPMTRSGKVQKFRLAEMAEKEYRR